MSHSMTEKRWAELRRSQATQARKLRRLEAHRRQRDRDRAEHDEAEAARILGRKPQH